MQRFRSWKLWMIASSAVFGGFYGLCVIFSVKGANLSAFDATVSVAGGCILCACGAYTGWTLFRWLRARRRIARCKFQTQPADAGRKKGVSARLRFLFSELRDSQFPRSALSDRPFIELLICDGRNPGRQPRSVRRQPVSRDELKQMLKNLLEDSSLE